MARLALLAEADRTFNMYYVYVLKSINYKKSYVGMTKDLDRRLTEHNQGKSYYTRRYKPWEIIYKELFNDELEAARKEKYFKSRSGRRKLKEIFDNYCGVV